MSRAFISAARSPGGTAEVGPRVGTWAQTNVGFPTARGEGALVASSGCCAAGGDVWGGCRGSGGVRAAAAPGPPPPRQRWTHLHPLPKPNLESSTPASPPAAVWQPRAASPCPGAGSSRYAGLRVRGGGGRHGAVPETGAGGGWMVWGGTKQRATCGDHCRHSVRGRCCPPPQPSSPPVLPRPAAAAHRITISSAKAHPPALPCHMPHLRPPICSSRRALLPSPLTSRLLRPSRLQEGAGEGGQGGDGGPGVHGEHSGARRQMAGTSCGKGCAGAALGCAGTSGSGGRRASSPPSPALPHAAPETAHLLFPSCAAAFSSDQSIALPFSPAGGGRGGGAGRGRWSWRARRARWGAAADGRHVTWERLCWGGAGLHRHWRQAAGRQAGRPAGRQDCLAAALQGRACSAGPSPSPIHPLFPQSARPPACAPMAERKARPSSFSTSSRKRARISSSLMLLGSTRSSATAAPPFSPPFSPAGGGQGRGGGRGGEGGPGVHGGARWGAAAAVVRCISSAGGGLVLGWGWAALPPAAACRR